MAYYRFLGAVALVTGTSALAQIAAPVAPMAATAPKPPKTLKFVDVAAVQPTALLAAPPARGSTTEAIELAEVRRIVTTATPARIAQAHWDDDHEDPSIFDAAIGGGFAMSKLPATTALLLAVRNDAGIVTNVAKVYWKRIRPWGIDATLPNCDAPKGKSPIGSYPSGHSTTGYAFGLALAQLLPEKADVIQERARDYAFSRIVCGVHFPSDIEASHVVSATVVARLMMTPAFQPQIAAARAELKAAGFTAR